MPFKDTPAGILHDLDRWGDESHGSGQALVHGDFGDHGRVCLTVWTKDGTFTAYGDTVREVVRIMRIKLGES